MIKKFFTSNPIHKRIVPYFDILMIFRPTLFFSVWVMICIGMYISSILNDTTQMNIVIYDMSTTLLLFGITLVCGSTFVLNQVTDADSDKINKKLFLINEIVSINKAILLAKYATLFGLVIVTIIDFFIVIPLLLIYVIWGILYNHNKYNLKSRPWLGLLCNIICGYLLILIGMIYNRYELNLLFILINSIKFIIPFICSYCSVVLLTNIPDLDGDKSVNKNTFTVLFGNRITIILSTFFCITSFLIGLYLNEPLSTTSALTSIPFFLFAFIRGEEKDILRAIRYPIFLLNFYVLTIYPMLFLPVMITYYVSKYYYWHRFNLHYPTLLVDND